MAADLFRVDTTCSGEAFFSGQNNKKSLTQLVGRVSLISKTPPAPQLLALTIGPCYSHRDCPGNDPLKNLSLLAGLGMVLSSLTEPIMVWSYYKMYRHQRQHWWWVGTSDGVHLPGPNGFCPWWTMLWTPNSFCIPRYWISEEPLCIQSIKRAVSLKYQARWGAWCALEGLIWITGPGAMEVMEVCGQVLRASTASMASTARQVTHHAAHAVTTRALRNESTLPHGLWCVWAGENESRRRKSIWKYAHTTFQM